MVDVNKRLLSLDAFRGMTIAGMILVNTPGSWAHVYPPLLHAKWHGCTPTDLVFPFFLFIVGVSMRFSYAKFDYKWSASSALKLLKRTLLIFIIGLLLNAFPFYGTELSQLRIFGVLQRIALAFGIGGLIVLLTQGRRWVLVIVSAILLLAYWMLLGLTVPEGAYTLESNLVRKVVIFIFGSNHLYTGFGLPFDPEGLLSSIPAVGTVLTGFLVGSFFQKRPDRLNSILKISVVGVGLILLGWIWGLAFPINKPLWTSSYVLYTAGIATLGLSLFYWLIDVKEWKRWSNFFVVFGVNPLFGFVLSVVWVKIIIKILRFKNEEGGITTAYSWLYNELFAPLAGALNGSFLFAVTHIIFFWLVLFILYKRKIFIKI